MNPAKQIDDVIDITKQYHNLLQRAENDITTAFTWDSNVLSALEGDRSYHYLQDELGSPMRFLGQSGREREVYGYDEFGQETYNFKGENENSNFNKSYKVLQPFSYTGYQNDSVANTMFAQTREYCPEVGRFAGKDIIKGNGAYSFTLNRYTYCWNQPMNWVDLNGLEVEKTYTLEPTNDINGIGLSWDSTGTKGTVLYGNDASVEDAYAIIALDKMNDSGYSQSEMNKFVETYRKNNNNDTLITANKGIEYYTNFEDITKSLTSQMLRNEYEFKDYYSTLAFKEKLGDFRSNVQNRGPWDLKQSSNWGNSSLYIFNGEIVDRDAPGNILYGYMGISYKIPDIILYLGASYAQLQSGTFKVQWLPSTFGDDPMDQINIQRGILFYSALYSGEGDIAWGGCDD